MRNLDVTKGRYQGNNLARRFAIPFEYNRTTQINVTITTYENGEYSYSLLNPENYLVDESSLEIVYPKNNINEPLKTNEWITIWRNTDLLQLIDMTNQGAAWPETIEAGLDKLHQIVQEMFEKLSRTLILDIGNPQTIEDLFTSLDTYVYNAATSAANAATSEANAATSAANAANSETNAATSAANAEGWAAMASSRAASAEQSAISAKAYSAPDWNAGTAYTAGEVVSYIDGNSYRCIADCTGIVPTNTAYWTKITAYVGDDFWLLDAAGYIVPNTNPTYSGRWAIDGNGYIVPINNVA